MRNCMQFVKYVKLTKQIKTKSYLELEVKVLPCDCNGGKVMENVEGINVPQIMLAMDDLSSTKFEDFINAFALSVEKQSNSVLEVLESVA